MSAATAYENLRIEHDGAVAVLTIAREKARNALNRATLVELERALGALEEDGRVRAVVVTGAGDKAFVAGADIAEMGGLGPIEARAFSECGRRAGEAVRRMTKPVIAAVNGFALGGGCELALACDFIYAAETAQLGQPEVKLGVICGFGGTQRMARRVGPARAMELVLSGEAISAQEALRIGLVNKVCAPGELLAEAKKTALAIASRGPIAIAYSKRLVRAAEELPLAAGLDLEAELFALTFATADRQEGMSAFLAKRPPAFSGK